MKYTKHTHTGQRKGHNEDSVATVVMEDTHLDTDRDVGLFVLSDGAGGLERGEVASYIATTEVIRKLSGELYPLLAKDSQEVGIELPEKFATQSTKEKEDSIHPFAPDAPNAYQIREKLVDAVNSAHQRMIEYAKENEMSTGPHATIVVGLYIDDILHYAWVGDSRLYVLDIADENLDLLTKDHSRVQDLEDQNKVDEIEAKIHPDGNQITRALGGSASKEVTDTVNVDTNSVEIYDTDVVFFTSDGIIDAYPHIRRLWGMYQSADQVNKEEVAKTIWDTVVSEDEIRDVILDCISGSNVTEAELATAGQTLLTVGNRHGGKDNMSFIFLSNDSALPRPDELPARGPDTGVEISKPASEGQEEEVEEVTDETKEDQTADTTPEIAEKGGEDSTPDENDGENETETPPGQVETAEASGEAADSRTEEPEEAASDSKSGAENDVLVLSREDSGVKHRIENGDIVGSSTDADHTVTGVEIADKHASFELTNDGTWKVNDLKTQTGTSVLEASRGNRKVLLGTQTQLLEAEVSEGEWVALGAVKDPFEIIET